MAAVEATSLSDAVVVADVVRFDDARLQVRIAIASVGDRRVPVVSWVVDASAEEPPVVAVARASDRCSLAVVVGAELSIVDLRDGTRSVIEEDVQWPAETNGEGVLAWGADGPSVVAAEAVGPRRLPLADGRELVLDVSVSCDDGFSGGDQSGAMFVTAPVGTSELDVASAQDALQAKLDEQAMVEHRAWARIEGPHPPAVLFDADESGAYGSTTVHWPVSEGPSGVIVRASTTRVVGLGRDETEIARPWFVGRDGAVRRLDVRLGNAPVCELPDGRWLMPGADELWCDSGHEPLHALGLDGRLSPWHPGPDVTTVSLLQEVAPDLLPPKPPQNLDDWPWLTAAHVAADGQRLVLLITDVPWKQRWDPGTEAGWAVVSLPSDGSGTPTLLAKGRRTAKHFSAIAL